MKKGFTLIELLVAIAIVAVVIGIGFGLANYGKEVGKKSVQIEAVKMGVARWTVTNEQGDMEFRWNSPKALHGWTISEDGILALIHATNEFGVLDVRWLPPNRVVETNVFTTKVP